ncbi:hypothetical protein [Sphingomonas sp. BK235]|uniref:hypothetical protein n=1 Tax=Sphingomonas sp. BK235 TaxID=2512131 RepID=UPI00104354BC|nr:hypothetical protein [Sphingomonas sp. BK235]TCP36536.1 hypothetical protein EV292_10132 [Sphingomonas sp. BK235]
MSSWRDVAAAAAEQRQQLAPPEPETYGLAPDLIRSLRELDQSPPPRRLEDARQWRPVVRDALRIVREGWAARALTLGWSHHDLFGIGPVDDWEFSGLAVWLNGRPLLSLDDATASAGGESRFGSIFIRGGMGHGTHPTVTPVLLWEFAR